MKACCHKCAPAKARLVHQFARLAPIASCLNRRFCSNQPCNQPRKTISSATGIRVNKAMVLNNPPLLGGSHSATHGQINNGASNAMSN